jgi:translation elongation factor EF-Tu-like GTPase
MGRKEDNIRKAQALMRKPEFIRNIGTAAHIDHGKTTLSDNLIAGSGMMSEDLAGKQLLLDRRAGAGEHHHQRGQRVDGLRLQKTVPDRASSTRRATSTSAATSRGP